MFAANKEHKETLQRMEQKFFEEKVRKDLRTVQNNKQIKNLKIYAEHTTHN